MTDEYKEQRRYEKHVRWQEIRITQFGYVTNLVLILAVGTLGFFVSLLTDNGHKFNFVYCLALLAVVLSIGSGLVCSITRLCDVRKTAKIALLNKRWKGNDQAGEIGCLRRQTKLLGNCSWYLLWCQIISFIGAIVLFMFWLYCIFHESPITANH